MSRCSSALDVATRASFVTVYVMSPPFCRSAFRGVILYCHMRPQFPVCFLKFKFVSRRYSEGKVSSLIKGSVLPRLILIKGIGMKVGLVLGVCVRGSEGWPAAVSGMLVIGSQN